MARLYLSAVEFIKCQEFDVWVPLFYQPQSSDATADNNPRVRQKVNPFKAVPVNFRSPLPFRQVVDPSQMQKAGYSIEIMLDMFQKKVEFELANEDDIVAIFDGIDRYLLSLQHDVETGVEHVIAYATLMVKFRAEMYKHYYRYMMTHPTALETLYPNNSRTRNVVHLMALATGKQEHYDKLDPLRAKANPPYPIGTYAKKEDYSDDSMVQLETTLGLSPSKSNSPDGDLDFEAFMGRR